MAKKPWWEPVLADAAYAARLRADYPETCEGKSDEWVLDHYADGRKYAVTWDHVGDAYEQFEELADAYFELKSQVGKSAEGGK